MIHYYSYLLGRCPLCEEYSSIREYGFALIRRGYLCSGCKGEFHVFTKLGSLLVSLFGRKLIEQIIRDEIIE